jgi:hypothetical protein
MPFVGGHSWQAMQPKAFVNVSSSTQVLGFCFKGFYELFVIQVQ